MGELGVRDIGPGILPGFGLWPGRLSPGDQASLLELVLAAIEDAPLYQPVTPGGRPFSVRMTNLGPLGWVSDRAGYRYQPTHPETGRPWPHQDKDEADMGAPVVSISLGDTAVFRIGPAEGGRTATIKLASGDVCAFGGPARLARHGIDRVLEGSSRLVPGGGRINLTLRKAA